MRRSATAATAAAAWVPGGAAAEARDDPPPGSRGEHAARLLPLAEDALARAGLGWEELDRVAVGVGPGGFTGLRIGIATARGLAQARGLPLVPVGSLEALAVGAAEALDASPPTVIAAVLDARRGEVYAAAWAGGEPVLAPAALTPEDLATRLAALAARVQAVGDGAVRFRQELTRAGVAVPADGSAAHRIGAAALCRLGAAGEPVDRDGVLPDYRREPDAKPPQR
jgi:tRNA threonylcarbamoyladenosine biosynthesis protein TsaB